MARIPGIEKNNNNNKTSLFSLIFVFKKNSLLPSVLSPENPKDARIGNSKLKKTKDDEEEEKTKTNSFLFHSDFRSWVGIK